jgi:hypothetical protein
MTTTFGSAKWQGRIWDGEGAISTKSGALTDYPYESAVASKTSQVRTPKS